MIESLLGIWLLHAAVLLSPGANFLLVSQLAASADHRGAMFAALGVAVGAAVWTLSAVMGLHALFQIFPNVRLALQTCGGLYLLYVATRLWRANASHPVCGGKSPSVSAAFRRGLLTNVTNPKAALFFGSVFAAWFPEHPGAGLQAGAVFLVALNSLCWHLLLAYLFSRVSIRSRYARIRFHLNKAIAAAVGAMGLALLISSLREAQPQGGID